MKKIKKVFIFLLLLFMGVVSTLFFKTKSSAMIVYDEPLDYYYSSNDFHFFIPLINLYDTDDSTLIGFGPSNSNVIYDNYFIYYDYIEGNIYIDLPYIDEVVFSGIDEWDKYILILSNDSHELTIKLGYLPNNEPIVDEWDITYIDNFNYSLKLYIYCDFYEVPSIDFFRMTCSYWYALSTFTSYENPFILFDGSYYNSYYIFVDIHTISDEPFNIYINGNADNKLLFTLYKGEYGYYYYKWGINEEVPYTLYNADFSLACIVLSCDNPSNDIFEQGYQLRVIPLVLEDDSFVTIRDYSYYNPSGIYPFADIAYNSNDFGLLNFSILNGVTIIGNYNSIEDVNVLETALDYANNIGFTATYKTFYNKGFEAGSLNQDFSNSSISDWVKTISNGFSEVMGLHITNNITLGSIVLFIMAFSILAFVLRFKNGGS